ncbi:cyclase family protein [Pseudooceanicola sp.]|uniref:cyclase family protein n=1 Tax=Pseudooceanicola sp. TaxID=1914328 RepID=UPI00261A6A2F|nr:cyclase family protein [Pseudooceanicola sp.]MDF1855731.1 cyclase family protein [Pseudooceanicola sp.]
MHHDHSHWDFQAGQGASAHLTPEKTLAALALVSQGQIHDISQQIYYGAPCMGPNQSPFLMSIFANWRDTIRRRRATGHRNEMGTNLERIEMTMHTGTHVDALGHVSTGSRMFGGRSAEDEVTSWGLETLGAEQIPPMITRGILFDVGGAEGLNTGDLVTAADLERAAGRGGFQVEPGDVALIRTGWGRHYETDNARYLQGEPGIGVEAAAWLIEQGVVAIGADNMAVEVLPGTDPEVIMPVHQLALVEHGVWLIENLALEGVVRDGLATACFAMLSPKIRGATGAPVRPVLLR